MNRKLAAVIVVLAWALGSVLAQTLPPGVQKKAFMGGITEYDSPNGLKVLLFPDAAEPKITVNVTYLVGSRHEGYGETGMAHLLGHMDFIETTSGRQIKDELVSHGANWNGTTADDRTNLYETFTATDDNLRWALGLETDRMVNVTSRISDRIRNREGLSYGTNARITVPAEGDSAMLSGTVSLNPAVGPKVESSFTDELKKVYESGFTAAEVAVAKKADLDLRMIGRSTDAALLNLLASHEQLEPLRWDADLEAKIQALTLDQINAVFRKHIDPNGVSIVKAGDFKTAGVYR